MDDEPIGHISADGAHYWNGQQWVTTLSPDGRWRWDGKSWAAAGARQGASEVAGNAGSPASIPSLKIGRRWKVGLIGIGLVLAVTAAGAIAASNSTPPSGNAGQRVAQGDVAGTPSPSTSEHAAPPGQHPTPSPSPSPSPRPAQSPSPSPSPPAAPAPPPSDRCGAPANPWGYNFCSGAYIFKPPSTFCTYFVCIGAFWSSTNGYVVECVDATYSHSGGQRGACSHHGGEWRPLYA